MHHVSYFVEPDNPTCPHCNVTGALKEVKSPERAKEETEASKERQRFQYWQNESFNPSSWESQLGHALTSSQLLQIIQKWIPGAKMFPQFNKFIGKTLAAYYVPWRWSPEDDVSATERRGSLKFICCGENGIMPEWDVHPMTNDRMPLPQIRGWRSVLGIFYRSGLIPFVPDDGRRVGWWTIKESPFKEKQ
jgi:hypothetical protein